MEKKRHPGSIPWFKEESKNRRKYPLTPDESYHYKEIEEQPDGLCEECGEGILRLIATNPGYRGSTEVYECSECGHRESFPFKILREPKRPPCKSEAHAAKLDPA